MQSKKQIFNAALVIIGAGLIMFSFISAGENKYAQIGGLVILMFGLYRATQTWVDDNRRDKNEEGDENR